MPKLYPSWIEIPVADMDRALAFYRVVFGLVDTPLVDEPPDMRIAVLLPSEKEFRSPGVSLVRSALHRPGDGPIVNFHLDRHADLDSALERIVALGGEVRVPLVDMGDGVRYVNVRDSEGNPLALSSYEEPET